jgi:hypothetical protein
MLTFLLQHLFAVNLSTTELGSLNQEPRLSIRGDSVWLRSRAV